MAKIELKNIYKIFGNPPEHILEKVKAGASKEDILDEFGFTIGLNNINLKINKGETFVVMGLSGSGKSTLIRHINRLIDPSFGEIIIDGENILGLSQNDLKILRRTKMSMVFQRFGLLPHKSILENVATGLEIQGITEQKAKDKAMEQIELVGLNGYENQYPSQLSGGMQQRVGLARALATDADILLLDEAFSALDPLIRNEMQQQLVILQKKLHKTIIFITHDLDEALRLGDRIAILKDGELSQVGNAEEILLNPADDYVERFVEDVNRMRVVTVGTIANDTPTIFEDDLADVEKHFDDNDDESVVIVNDENYPIGAVMADECEGNDNDSITPSPVKTVNFDQPLEEIVGETIQSDIPLCVIDEDENYTGTISKDDIMQAIVTHSRDKIIS